MKKMRQYIVPLAALLVLVVAGAAMAAPADDAQTPSGVWNFGQMLPYMQQMHPDLSVDELRGYYEACHGTGGASPSANWSMGYGMMGW